MTLDYNFEANFWAAATSNHAGLIASTYAASVLALLPISRARAALPDWSEGGWPDQYGGEVVGMSCGPTVDWDHDYGCPKGFGSFRGIEMPSATGPFRGMHMFFDDGTRFVAGLAATPLVQYYDSTLDGAFWNSTLLPYLEGVADFYMSYSIKNSAGSSRSWYELPYTCAQETCTGLTQRNGHQDLAYFRMALTKLLQYTSESDTAMAAKRARWRDYLENLVGFPTTTAAFGSAGCNDTSSSSSSSSSRANCSVFADAAISGGAAPNPTGNAGYGISHMAAIFPAQLIGLDSPAELLKTARATVDVINRAVSWESEGGFDMVFPQASRLARYQDSDALLARYAQVIKRTSLPNGYTFIGGGGLEMIGAADGVHALLLQSHEGVIRIFPTWPRGADRPEYSASFATLRAAGAFLVSARWNGTTGAVQAPVQIQSEKGVSCVFEDPWQRGLQEEYVATYGKGQRQQHGQQHGQPLCVVEERTGMSVNVSDAGNMGYKRFDTQAGLAYLIRPC